MRADIKEIFICRKCRKDFEEAEAIREVDKLRRTRLSCPFCLTFRQYAVRPMPAPGEEIVFVPGKHYLQKIAAVYKRDPEFVEWQAGQSGRIAKAASLYLAEIGHRFQQAG